MTSPRTTVLHKAFGSCAIAAIPAAYIAAGAPPAAVGYTNCIWLHRRGEKTLSDTTTSGCQWLSWVSASTFDDLERLKAKGLGPARRRGVRLAGRFPVRTVRRGG